MTYNRVEDVAVGNHIGYNWVLYESGEKNGLQVLSSELLVDRSQPLLEQILPSVILSSTCSHHWFNINMLLGIYLAEHYAIFDC